jgi:hypothetical protein
MKIILSLLVFILAFIYFQRCSVQVPAKEDETFDFFIFGSSSTIAKQLFKDHQQYFKSHVRKLHLIQRNSKVDDVFKDFNHDITILDCSDANIWIIHMGLFKEISKI